MKFYTREFDPEIADISMEAMLKNYYPTFSGGLGGIQGDNFRAYADLGIPAVGVLSTCTNGYFRQIVDKKSGWQFEEPTYWDPDSTLGRIEEECVIKNKGHDLYVGAHLFIQKGETGHKIPVILLTTDLEKNTDSWDRGITGTLYDSSDEYKISQRNVLGQGAVKLLERIWKNIKIYHLNEGHSAFASLLKDNCVFTNHTPVDAGFDRFDYGLANKILGDLLPKNIRDLAGYNDLNMNRLAANKCRLIDGVSRRHAEFCRKMEVFKGKNVGYITNGIHPRTWVTKSFEKLFDSHLPHWSIDPRILSKAEKLSLEEVLEAKDESKRYLIGNINKNYPVKFKQDVLTLVWARRFAEYKRPELILNEEAGLHEVATEKCPIQLIFAGKSHPNDTEAKKQLQRVYQSTKNNNNNAKSVFIEDFDADTLKMLCGADVWVNTPRPPMEASGTSGMKASLNGCLNLSSLDGWVCEGVEMYPDAFFIIGPRSNQINFNENWQEADKIHAQSLKERLKEISQLFYSCSNDKPNLEWARRMRESIKLIYFYNSHRVVKQKLVRWGLVETIF